MSHDTTDGPTFILKEKILALGTDYWVEDDQGQRHFKADGKVMRIGNRMVLEDPSGAELFTIKHQLVSVRNAYGLQVHDPADSAIVVAIALGLEMAEQADHR